MVKFTHSENKIRCGETECKNEVMDFVQRGSVTLLAPLAHISLNLGMNRIQEGPVNVDGKNITSLFLQPQTEI